MSDEKKIKSIGNMTPTRPKRTKRASKGALNTKNVMLSTNKLSKKKTVSWKLVADLDEVSIGSPKTQQKSPNPSSNEEGNDSPGRNPGSSIKLHREGANDANKRRIMTRSQTSGIKPNCNYTRRKLPKRRTSQRKKTEFNFKLRNKYETWIKFSI